MISQANHAARNRRSSGQRLAVANRCPSQPTRTGDLCRQKCASRPKSPAVLVDEASASWHRPARSQLGPIAVTTRSRCGHNTVAMRTAIGQRSDNCGHEADAQRTRSGHVADAPQQRGPDFLGAASTSPQSACPLRRENGQCASPVQQAFPQRPPRPHPARCWPFAAAV